MQKKTLQITLTVLFLAVALMLLSTSAIAPVPTPAVDTDKPIYPYWKVGGNVRIFGSGYDASKVYRVVITYPGALPTVFSVFTSVTDFEYIHPLVSPYPAGTYLVEIYEYPPVGLPVLVASCHFGVWGIDPPVYNRGESITIQGGGVCPNSMVAIDIYYDEDGNSATTGDQTQMDVPDYWGAITDPTADANGEFTKVVDIPIDAWVSDDTDAIYFVEITYDSYDGCGTNETGLTDTQTFEVSATYTVTISGLPTDVMNRGEVVTFTVTVTDASGDLVIGATVTFNDPKGNTVSSGIIDNSDGTYSVTYTIADDDPTGTWTITATATKDGNTGSSPGTDTVEISATYTISWYDPTSAVLKNRGHTQDFYFLVTDASGDPVDGLGFLFLDIDGDLATTDDQYSISLIQVYYGEYIGSWTVPSDAPTGDYDGIVVKSGNRGETPDYVTVSDLLIVDLTIGAGTYGGLDTIYFEAEIDYEDGTDFTDMDGTATANIWIDVNDDGEIDAGEFVVDTDVPLSYDSGNDLWFRYYDLYPPGAIGGKYKIKVNAADPNGNSGTDSVTFDLVAQTMKDPTHGPVGTEVEIWGSGFAPDAPITITFYMGIADDVIGAGDGMRTDFMLVMMPVLIVEGSETIYLDGVETTDYTIDYATGVITFLTPPDFGVVITADYDYRTFLAWTSTNEYGSFSATFTVPESYNGPHGVDAFQEGLDPVRDIFTVEPQIVLSSTKGPPEGWITVTGTGFVPNSEVYIDGLLPGYPGWGGFEWTWALAETDPLGTFSEAIALPVLYLQQMYWDSGISIAPIGIYATDWFGNCDFTFYIATLFCEPSTIDVQVQVGALYFPGEIITAYASTSVDGAQTDVENIEFLAYYETAGPTPMTQWLPVIHIDTGLYAITTTLPPGERPGNYLIEVKASKITHYGWDWFEDWWGNWAGWFDYLGMPDYWSDEWIGIYDEFMDWEGIDVTINGCGIDGFIISPTLMGMDAWIKDIKAEIAEIVIPGIGTIQMTLDAIRTEELAELLSNTAQILENQELLAELIADLKVQLELDLEELADLIVSVEQKLQGENEDILALIASVADKLQIEHEGLVTLITEVFDALDIKLDDIKTEIIGIEENVDGLYLVIGDLEVKLDDVQAKLVDIQDDLIRIETAIGDLELTVGEGLLIYLEAIEAKLDFVNATTIRIESAIGDIEVNLEDIGDFLLDIKAEIVAIEGHVTTINTNLGIIQTDIDNINLRVTSIEGNIVTITSTLGTIQGRITAIEGDLATIQADIGEIQVELPPLQESSSAIESTTTLGMSIGSVLSAIAAIGAVAACILIHRRLRVAS